MACLGVILARGGSRRIPRKNLRMLGGQPLIAWTIGAAFGTQHLDGLVVSSDDDEILNAAHVYGVCTIKRPVELASDTASSYPALLHAVDQCGIPPELVCLLQPTSPYRTSEDIDACISMMYGSDWPAVVSREVGHSVPNGAVYVGRLDWLRDGGSFDSPAVGFYDMPSQCSVDIDTEDDWKEAERILAGMR